MAGSDADIGSHLHPSRARWPLAEHGHGFSRRPELGLQVQTRLCMRRRLLEMLDAARPVSLSMLIAPPGFGKTIALAQWRAQLSKQDIRTVWCDLHQFGKSAPVLLDILSKALSPSNTDSSEPPFDSDFSLPAALDAIRLWVELNRGQAVIILDHYSAIESAANNAALVELLEFLPPNIHIALSSRQQPALPVTLPRLEQIARLIGVDELSLSEFEIADVLGNGMSDDDLDLVTRRTGGWPVAVRIYAEQNASPAISAVGAPLQPGDAPGIAEYLDAHIGPLLDTGMRNLIMDLAVFDAFETDMVEYVRDRSDHARQFARLQLGLPGLVQRLHREPAARYRLHPLLRDYALALLSHKSGRRAQLHGRASHWFADRYRWPEAVRHAACSGDKALLHALLEGISPFEEYLRGGPSAIKALLHEIPAGVLRTQPRLRVAESLIHFKAGYIAEARQELAILRGDTENFTCDPAGNHHALLVEASALELVYQAHATRADFGTMAGALADLRARSAPFPVIWAVIETIEVVLSQQSGDLNNVRAALDRWCHVCDTHRLQFNRLQLQLHELLLLLSRGQLDALRNQVARTRKMRRETFDDERPVLAMCEIASIAIAYERGPSESQASTLMTIVETMSLGDQFSAHLAIIYPITAELAFFYHGAAAVERHLDRAEARLAVRNVHLMDLLLPALRAKFLALSGDVKRAEEIALRHALACHSSADGNRSASWREREAVTAALIQLEIARDNPAQAALLARAMIEDATEGGRTRGNLTGLAYMAAAAMAMGDQAGARQILEDFLIQAAPQGFVAPLLEAGPLLQPALEMLASDETLSNAKRRQLHIVRAAQRMLARSRDQELLNDRQLEVIQYLSSGLSNKRIALRLGISEHTVKFHLKKIYRILQVGGRRQAIATYCARMDNIRRAAMGSD